MNEEDSDSLFPVQPLTLDLHPSRLRNEDQKLTEGLSEILSMG